MTARYPDVFWIARVFVLMTNSLLEKLTRLANTCGDAEVKAWLGKHIANELRKDRRARSPRERGVKVRLGSARGPHAVIAASAIERLKECD